MPRLPQWQVYFLLLVGLYHVRRGEACGELGSLGAEDGVLGVDSEEALDGEAERSGDVHILAVELQRRDEDVVQGGEVRGELGSLGAEDGVLGVDGEEALGGEAERGDDVRILAAEVTARSEQGTIVVHVGDALEILTNGRYTSVLHRSLVCRDAVRVSWVVFCEPPPESVLLQPLPELLANGAGKPLFAPRTFKQHVQRKLIKKLKDQQDNNAAAASNGIIPK
ncbi:hypothetical protein OsI_23780 [Oryza sativa Indica Group]|uniref:Isopenicillin N synthase-like Fe(2+) 2OG dioxygenase domain-containing protein n=1 Tax=Oryza sativa subsp. indica TaxID=39946 RepID=B8B0F1_ORYSI|nr:hypothetical protein OsI_23780 [Oryza sativa Indica Group]